MDSLARLGLVCGHSYRPRGYAYYLRQKRPRVRREDALIVGDAVGLATLNMGEGIGPAIQSGLLAAEAILHVNLEEPALAPELDEQLLDRVYRLYRTECLRGVRIRAQRYDSESEILVRLARRGARIGSVPVSTVYGEEKSSINPLVDTGRFVRLVWRLLRDRD